MQKIFYQKRFILPFLMITLYLPLQAQENGKQGWDLNQCLNYASEHNIQVKKKQLDVVSSEAGLYKAKSERLPNLSASISESFNNAKEDDEWSLKNGTALDLSSNLTLYKGGAIKYTIKQSQLNVDLANLNVEVAKNSIELSITQAYLNVLYAKETRDYNKEVVDKSEKQVIRSRELLKAGSISRSDLAQIEAELASDKYTLVQAENNLVTRTTTLKQLLEIPTRDTFNVSFPEVNMINDIDILPSKLEAFDKAISARPEIKSSQVSKSIAQLDVSIAKTGYIPSLSLSAKYSTNYSNSYSQGLGSQINSNQNQQVGVTLSIPIFNRNETRTSIQQKMVSLEQAQLDVQETEKNLLQEVESAYQNVVNGKSRYDAAVTQLESANESYKLVEDQFNLGIKNTIELLTAKSTVLNAKTELIQSKYNAILSRKILDFYMGKPITL